MTLPYHTVAVTGASGFLGRYVVRALLARGYHVRALVRSREKANAVLPADPRLTLVEGSILDRRSPGELVAGAQAAVNLIGIIREARRQTFKGMHVDAVSALLDACHAADPAVRRLVHISAVGITPDGKAEYQRTKFAGEALVRKSGLDWTVLRPGLVHGPDGEFVQMVQGWTSGSIAPYFFVPYFTRMVEHEEGVPAGRISFEAAEVAPVAVTDVAEAVCRALERCESIGEVYNVVGPEVYTWKTLFETFAEHLPGSDSTLPVIGLPARPHAHMAAVAKKLGMGALFPFDAGQAFMAEDDVSADLDKVRTDLGLQPRAFKQVLKEYAPSMPGAH